MKIIYLASSEIALNTFYELLKHQDIIAVITQPDKPKGRSNIPAPSPVAQAAVKENIKLYKADKFDDDLIDELKKLKADIFIVFSFGVILKEKFFSIAKYGGINIHPSMLPELRGPSPIKTAVLLGMKCSGVTIQQMKLKVDSGDILYQKEFEIKEEDDAASIEDKVSILASKIIIPVLENIEKGDIKPVPQDESMATYCKLFLKDDGLIDWNDSGEKTINKIRACVNWPVAFSYIDGIRVNIYKAKINKYLSYKEFKDFDNGRIIFADKNNGIVVKTNDCLINIDVLQQKGKKVLNYRDFINGYRNLNGKKFSLME